MSHIERASLKSIAEKFGISVSTVSRVLSGKARQYRISTKTEELVREEADRLGFSPNQIASSLRLKRTRTLGLLIPDISNSFFASVARSVEVEARKRGYSIILADSQENKKIEQETIRLLKSRNIDGLIVAPVGQISEHLEKLHKGGLPVVLLDRYFHGTDLPFVTSDNYKGAFEATEYLILKGHEKIACVGGLPDTSTCLDRRKGYRDAMKKHGRPQDESMIVGDDFGEENGYIESKLLLQRDKKPTAIFTLGNLNAFGAMRAIAEEGLSIPDDVSLISFDDYVHSAFLATPLTAVAQQMEAIGQFAVKLLYNQLDSASTAKSKGISLATQFNERASVKDLTPNQ